MDTPKTFAMKKARVEDIGDTCTMLITEEERGHLRDRRLETWMASDNEKHRVALKCDFCDAYVKDSTTMEVHAFQYESNGAVVYYFMCGDCNEHY